MKKVLWFVITIVLALNSSHSKAAAFLPLLNTLRSEIITNIALLTNGAAIEPEQQKQLRALQQARRAIDRPARASLFNDVQVLANITPLLVRGFPNGEIDGLLSSTLLGYRAALTDFALLLQTNATSSPLSNSSPARASAIANVLITLEQIDPSLGLLASARALSRASVQLRALQVQAIPRTGPTTSRPERFSARIGAVLVQANASGASAIYNQAGEFLTVSGRAASGVPPASRTIKLFIANVTPGTTSHSFGPPDTGTYAIYSATSTNFSGGTSVSGNALITLDATARTVSGRFSFDAADALSFGPAVRVTAGEFFLRF